MKNLQNNVHELRQNEGLTQQQLADILDVTRQTVIAIEKGNYTPSVALALSIAKYFEQSVESIFFYEKK